MGIQGKQSLPLQRFFSLLSSPQSPPHTLYAIPLIVPECKNNARKRGQCLRLLRLQLPPQPSQIQPARPCSAAALLQRGLGLSSVSSAALASLVPEHGTFRPSQKCRGGGATGSQGPPAPRPSPGSARGSHSSRARPRPEPAAPGYTALPLPEKESCQAPRGSCCPPQSPPSPAEAPVPAAGGSASDVRSGPCTTGPSCFD